MLFKEVVGQDEIKDRLRREADEGRVAHALLFYGPEGCGKLPVALAFARYLLCSQPHDGEPCNACNSCRMTARWAHPDLHFVFPVVKYKDAAHSVSDVYLPEWRKQLGENVYFGLDEWLEDMQAGNQQAMIYSAESDAIQKKLSLKSNQGGKKVMIIWLPEKMNLECANKLLKLLEEPPAETHFLLISERLEAVLPTIVSRAQCIGMKGLSEDEIAGALMLRNACDSDTARRVAHTANGNLIAAQQLLRSNADQNLFFDLFVILMRLSYQRKIKDLKKWSEQIAALGREKQKNFLAYSQKLIRENFIYNFRQPDLNYETMEEENFSRNFARFINERNVIHIMDELSLAQRDIEQNGNPKFVFFDFALKMIVLLIQ